MNYQAGFCNFMKRTGHHVSQKIFLVVFATLIFAGIGFSQTAHYGTDFQLWNETQVVLPLNKKKDLNIALWMIGRLGNNVHQVTDARIGFLLTKKVNKHVSLSGGYLYRYSNATFVRSRYESRFVGIATFTTPLPRKFTLINRNQIQYESRYLRPNAAVLRSRLMLRREVEIGGTKIELFASSEIFYDSILKSIARYRTQAGFSHKFSEKLTTDIYYVRQNELGRHTRPGTLNAIGTGLKITL